jgi:hypothetical protein
MDRDDVLDDYAVRQEVEAQAYLPDPDSVASEQPFAMLTEAELFGEDFMEWKRDTIAACDQLDAIFKERFGITVDEAVRRLQSKSGKRARKK